MLFLKLALYVAAALLLMLHFFFPSVGFLVWRCNTLKRETVERYVNRDKMRASDFVGS